MTHVDLIEKLLKCGLVPRCIQQVIEFLTDEMDPIGTHQPAVIP